MLRSASVDWSDWREGWRGKGDRAGKRNVLSYSEFDHQSDGSNLTMCVDIELKAISSMSVVESFEVTM